MSSVIAAAALGAFMTGVGASGSSARAAIPPEERSGTARMIYRIEPSAMVSALNTLADKNGLHVLYDSRMTEGLRTRGLKGKYGLHEALDRILSGTGLTYRLSADGRAVSIVLAQAATGTQSDASPVALPTINVDGGGAGTGGYSAPLVQQSTTKIAVPTFDLPISVQTVPRQVIQDQDSILLQETIQNVSGVRSNNSNLEGYSFNIRGFETQNVYRNGLLIGVAIPQVYDTANLQSVEVFKGPATYLFGRADPGGVINRVTKTPLDAPYYSLTEQFGSFHLWRQVWDLTGPVELPVLGDNAVAYRFAGAYTNDGEFVDFIRNEFLFLAPSIAWRIGPDTTLVVDAEYTNQNTQSNVGQPAISYDPTVNTDPASVRRPNLYPANIPPYRSFGEPNQPPDRVRSALIAYQLTHNFDNHWKLTNRFLATRATLVKSNLFANGFFDPDNPFVLDRSIGYQKLTGTNYSANLDLTGHFDILGARNDVLIGADYFYSFYNYIFSGSGSYPINVFNPIYGSVPTSDFRSAGPMAWNGNADFTGFSAVQERDLGIYVQDSITLFENLHVLLGGRYDLSDVHRGASRTTFAEVINPNTGESEFVKIPSSFGQAAQNFANSPNQHYQKLSPRIGINYQPVPWLAFYGSYTESFGATNGLSTTGAPFPPQLSYGWEGGVKAELLDRRLLATLAFFQITKANILTPIDPNDPFSEDRPIGKARSRGVEVDILGKLTDELNIIASYSHIDARIIKDNGGLVGNSLGVYAPDSGSLWLTYAFPNDSGLEGWTIGGGVFAASNRWGDDVNSFILPAYARLDAMARYQFLAGGAKWSAQFNINNIADTRYYPGNDTFYNNFGRFGIFAGAPRNIRASLRVEF